MKATVLLHLNIELEVPDGLPVDEVESRAVMTVDEQGWQHFLVEVEAL